MAYFDLVHFPNRATPISADLGDHNSTSLSWNVTLPAGWNVVISIEDADGEEAWSGSVRFSAAYRLLLLPLSNPRAISDARRFRSQSSRVTTRAV